MTVYYKATRPDGTDFYTGTVDYAAHLASGEELPVIESKVRECCSDSVYHASDTPAETLIGGSWPCRLFEVTGTPVADDGHKHGFATLKVMREIEAWQALGPNGVEVARLIERVQRMTPAEIEDACAAARNAARCAALNAARNAALRAALDAARNAARCAALNAALRAALDAAVDAAWGAVRGAARNAAWVAVWDAAVDAAWGAVRGAAQDAACALVVRDLITPEQFNLLTGSLFSVIGEDW